MEICRTSVTFQSPCRKLLFPFHNSREWVWHTYCYRRTSFIILCHKQFSTEVSSPKRDDTSWYVPATQEVIGARVTPGIVWNYVLHLQVSLKSCQIDPSFKIIIIKVKQNETNKYLLPKCSLNFENVRNYQIPRNDSFCFISKVSHQCTQKRGVNGSWFKVSTNFHYSPFEWTVLGNLS